MQQAQPRFVERLGPVEMIGGKNRVIVVTSESKRVMEIESSIRDINPIKKEISATIAPDAVASRMDASIKKLAASAKIKGFRPGKAPREIVRRAYEDRLFQEITTELAGEALFRVVKENSLQVVGEPEVDFSSAQRGEPLTFSAHIYVMPEPTIEGDAEFEVSVPKQEATNEKVGEALERLRKEHFLVIPTEGKQYAETGDTVEFTVTVEGAKDTAESPQQLRAELGAETLPPEVDTTLRSTAVGSSKKITIRHQGDARRAQAATQYTLTVTAIGTKALRELDDEFAKVVDPSVEGLAQLRETIREKMQANFDNQSRDAVRSEVLNQLVARNQFEVPPPLVDRELTMMARQLGGGENSSIAISAIRDVLGTVAADRVRAQVIVDEIAKKEGLTATVDELSAAIARQAESMGQPVAALERWVASSTDRFKVVEREVVRTKVLDLLETRATVRYSAEPVAEGSSSEGEDEAASESVAE